MSKFVVVRTVVETVYEVPESVAVRDDEVIIEYTGNRKRCIKSKVVLATTVVPYAPVEGDYFDVEMVEDDFDEDEDEA